MCGLDNIWLILHCSKFWILSNFACPCLNRNMAKMSCDESTCSIHSTNHTPQSEIRVRVLALHCTMYKHKYTLVMSVLCMYFCLKQLPSNWRLLQWFEISISTWFDNSAQSHQRNMWCNLGCTQRWNVTNADTGKMDGNRGWIQEQMGLPNCLGALDGKHVMICKLCNAGSLFFNYKGYHLIVLMALVDHNYRFSYVDIGGKLITGTLNFPPPKPLPNFPLGGVPHVIVTDEAFPLTQNIMGPFPHFRTSSLPKEQAIFNYRLSRARMVVENAFGILAMHWRLFDRRIALCADNADKIIKACCVLHNFLAPTKNFTDIASELNPDARNYSTQAMLYLPRLQGYHATQDAQGVRDIFKAFFNHNVGILSWQDRRVPTELNNWHSTTHWKFYTVQLIQ